MSGMKHVLIAAVGVLLLDAGDVRAQNADPAAANRPKVVAAAPGRIEGSSDAIAVGASISGIVERVLVRQGDAVAAGQVLLRLACGDIASQLKSRESEHEALTAVHQRLLNGPRPQEIEVAKSNVELAEARLAEADLRMTRSQTLVERQGISRAVFDTAERDQRMAKAQLESERLRLRLLQDGTRAEELAEAKARMFAAESAVAASRAELAKCEVKSPVDGIVLRKHVSESELVSVFFPKPLITVVELRHFRVRAEVDERDLPLVREGATVEIVINGAKQRRLKGKVASLAPVMGRRQILTSDPADKSDRDVREVLIDIDGKPEDLPIGLRVSVLFY
jgi:HlyD family secretion protein